MSKYFKKVTSYEDLKSQYRVLLKDNHPDNGGDVSKMQEINTEYDILFAVWKDRKEEQTGEKVTETADSTRSRFYTEFGWEGSNHDWNRSLKEIAAKEKNTDIFKDFEITESIHTKTGEKIYLARNKEPLTPDEFRAVREQMQGFGGYYSRYTHSFVFKENPLTNFEAEETPLIKENESIKDSTEPAERKTESNIADALKNRKTTPYGIYHDVGTVLDKFSTMELVNYVIKDVPSGDALLRDYLTNTIISHEINKVKMSESKQTDKPQQKPVRR